MKKLRQNWLFISDYFAAIGIGVDTTHVWVTAVDSKTGSMLEAGRLNATIAMIDYIINNFTVTVGIH